MTYNVIQGHW